MSVLSLVILLGVLGWINGWQKGLRKWWENRRSRGEEGEGSVVGEGLCAESNEPEPAPRREPEGTYWNGGFIPERKLARYDDEEIDE